MNKGLVSWLASFWWGWRITNFISIKISINGNPWPRETYRLTICDSMGDQTTHHLSIILDKKRLRSWVVCDLWWRGVLNWVTVKHLSGRSRGTSREWRLLKCDQSISRKTNANCFFSAAKNISLTKVSVYQREILMRGIYMGFGFWPPLIRTGLGRKGIDWDWMKFKT